MPEPIRRPTTAELLQDWLTAEQNALTAEGLAYDAELAATTAERDAVRAETAANLAFQTLEAAHFRYLQRMDELRFAEEAGRSER